LNVGRVANPSYRIKGTPVRTRRFDRAFPNRYNAVILSTVLFESIQRR
jgi:hypothetical protein